MTRPKSRFFGAMLLGCLGISAHAAVVVEDFNYPADGALLGQSGGSGWSGNWGPSTGTGANTSRIVVKAAANLTYSSGGYNITQTGTGRTAGNYLQFRGINRAISTNLTGTVWFSALVQNTDAAHHSGVEFNTHADSPFSGSDYTQGPYDVEIAGTNLVVRYNGTNNTVAGTTLGLSQTHLLLGRITFQDSGANDRLDVWADPADLTALGAPLFTANNADMGTDLYLAGLFAYGSVDDPALIEGSVDALRFSDGGGNASTAFTDVTNVPEPGTLLLVPAALLMLSRQKRSH